MRKLPLSLALLAACAMQVPARDLYLNSARSGVPLEARPGAALELPLAIPASGAFSLKFSVASRSDRQPWELVLAGERGDTLAYSFSFEESPSGFDSSVPFMNVAGGGVSSVFPALVRIGAKPLVLAFSGAGSGWTLEAGGKGSVELPAPRFDVTSAVIRVPKGAVSVDDLHLRVEEPQPGGVIPPEEIAAILEESGSPVCGEWRILDRTLEESLLKMGGDYLLAVIPGEEGYEIRYLSGASVCADRWEPGMLKGTLAPGPTSGSYALTWLDAEGAPMASGLYATLEENLLTLFFPYQNSQLRFTKVR